MAARGSHGIAWRTWDEASSFLGWKNSGGRSAAARAGDSHADRQAPLGPEDPQRQAQEPAYLGTAVSAGHKSARGGRACGRRRDRPSNHAGLTRPTRPKGRASHRGPGAGEPRLFEAVAEQLAENRKAEPPFRRGGPVAAAGDQRDGGDQRGDQRGRGPFRKGPRPL